MTCHANGIAVACSNTHQTTASIVKILHMDTCSAECGQPIGNNVMLLILMVTTVVAGMTEDLPTKETLIKVGIMQYGLIRQLCSALPGPPSMHHLNGC